MGHWAKQSTAVSYVVGPVLDSTGAEYASAVIGDLSISKNGGSLTALAASATLTYIANGQYTLALTTGNTDTLGTVRILCNKSTYQMPTLELMILPATVYDALTTNATTAAGGLGDIQRMAGTALTARDIGASVLLSSGTGTGQISLSSGLVTLAGVTHTGAVIPTVTTVTNQLTAAQIAAGVWQDTTAGDFTVASSIGKSLYTSGATPGAAGGLFIAGTNAATTVTTSFTTTFTGSLTGAVGSVTGNVGGSVASVTAGVTVTTNNDKTGYSLTVAPPTSEQIATAVWTDTTASDFTTALSVGKSLMNGVSLGTGLTVARCTLVDTLTTYTGNTPQTGDAYARIGATGSGLTSLAPSSTALSTATWTGTLATNLATLASHDPGATLGTSTLTQAQVTGGAYALNSASFAFDAALALTTQQKADVTAAVPTAAAVTTAVWASGTRTLTSLSGLTVDTVTTLTNLPTAPTDWVTAAAVSAAAVTKIQSGLSTYAGGDTSGTTTLLSRLTGTRAGYLDNLSGGAVMLASSYTAPLDAAGTRAAVGLGAADLDTQLNSIYTVAGLVQAKTDNLPSDPADASVVAAAFASLQSHGDSAWATATGFSTLDAAGVRTAVGLAGADLDDQLDAIYTAEQTVLGNQTVAGAQLTSIKLDTTGIADVPTAAENAAAWGARDLGYGVTADEYLQGYVPKVVFDATGLSATVYCGDETTVLQTLTATRLATTVGGLRTTNPG